MITTALRLAVLAALCAGGTFQVVRFLGTPEVAPRSGPHASSDQMLMVLGHPSPTAALLELLDSVPRDRAVTVVGFEPHLITVAFTIANLSFPRPTTVWECDPARPAVRQRLAYGTIAPEVPLAFVYSGDRIEPRPGYVTLTHRLIALRRLRGVPSPERLCAPGQDLHVGEALSRGRAALMMSRLLRDGGGAPPAARGLFEDVDPNGRQAAAIEEWYRRGLLPGCGRRRFCPEDPMARGLLAALAMAAADASQPEARGVFADVPASHPHAAAIEQAHALGVAACAQDPPRFCPESAVTREAAEVFLAAANAARRP